MTGKSQFEKRLDEYWNKHGNAAPVPVAAKNLNGFKIAALDISAAAEAQVALLRAEANQPDTSPAGRSRLAKASLKAMGLDDLFSGASKPGAK